MYTHNNLKCVNNSCKVTISTFYEDYTVQINKYEITCKILTNICFTNKYDPKRY